MNTETYEVDPNSELKAEVQERLEDMVLWIDAVKGLSDEFERTAQHYIGVMKLKASKEFPNEDPESLTAIMMQVPIGNSI